VLADQAELQRENVALRTQLNATRAQLAKAPEAGESSLGSSPSRPPVSQLSRSSTAPAGSTRGGPPPLSGVAGGGVARLPPATTTVVGGKGGGAGKQPLSSGPGMMVVAPAPICDSAADLRPSTAPVWMGEQLERHAIENHRLREQLLFFTSKSAVTLVTGRGKQPGLAMPLPPV